MYSLDVMSLLCRAGALCGALAAVGCGGNLGEMPLAEFPSVAEMEALQGQPAAPPPLPKTAPAVERWEIEEAPLPDAAHAPWQPSGRWETMFAEVAAGAAQRPRLTLAMGCVARELGRFYLERQALPDAGLRRFLVGGCGALVPHVASVHVSKHVPATVSDDQLLAQLGASLRAELSRSLGAGAQLAGFWAGRRDDRFVAFLVSAEEEAQIKPFSLTPDAHGEVVIEGRLNQPAQYFEAYINQGSVAAAPCIADLSVARPSFRFVCKPAPEDDTAWIQMLFAPPGRVLASTFAQALVRRSADVPPTYEAVRYAESTPVSSPEEFSRSVSEQLNRVRKAAGLSSVTLAARQSVSATKLAPRYFAAVLGGPEPEQADRIALGLLAGWDVGGMIRGATLMSEIVPTLDSSRWLTSALEMPLGRHTLFAPDIDQVSFGPVIEGEPGAIGAIVTGYRFHHGSDHTDDVEMLLSRVVEARRRLGLSAPLRLGTMAEVMREELTGVNQGSTTPRAAFDRVLARGVERFKVGMRGFMIEASSLDELEIPEEVLRQPTLQLDIGVTHHKAKGAAWAQYTIFVVYAALGDRT